TCTCAVGALTVTPLLSILTDVWLASENSMEPSESVILPVNWPGVVNGIVGPLLSSIIAIFVPAFPVIVQRSTLSPEPPNASGAASCPFQSPPTTTGKREAPERYTASTSSAAAGT